MSARVGCGTARGDTVISEMPSRNSSGTSLLRRATRARKSSSLMTSSLSALSPQSPVLSLIHPAKLSTATRSWFIASRSRTVTVPSWRVWPSTVMQNGVPASSMRR